MKARAIVLASLALVSLSAPRAARASVVEPNGQQVPFNNPNGEISLAAFFAQQGEGINWLNDAHTTPAVFSPLCGFTATYMLNQAGSHFGLAWYNVDPNAQSPPQDLHVIIAANSPVGTMVNSAVIQNDPGYKGGLVGFALVGGQTHYSEPKWTVNCGACGNPGPWILALMYQSTKIPNAYYVAFEDGDVDDFSFNNDGDFNDDVFLVTGVACSGAGMACNTGQPGICGDGLTQCDRQGNLGCKQLNQPGVETCDGLDNDCNGTVDDGAMCPNGQVCDRGQCVDPCGAAEFQCNDGLVCDNGVCVDQACAGVKCPAGQACHGGQCKGVCDGVACPFGRVCRAGRCVDPCANVMCPMDQVCAGGVCVPSCACQPCANGTACAQSGLCVEPACVNVPCPAGQHCAGGMCVDDCAGATCPPMQRCQMGECVDLPPADMAMTPPDFSQVASDDASAGTDDGGPGGNQRATGLRGGCGCRVGTRGDGGASALLVGMLLLVVGLRRRRRAA